jgi:hypothetical protein
MTDRKWFVPRAGQPVLDPATLKPIPPEGAWVGAHDEYFVRRETDGDGCLFDAPPEKAKR